MRSLDGKADSRLFVISKDSSASRTPTFEMTLMADLRRDKPRFAYTRRGERLIERVIEFGRFQTRGVAFAAGKVLEACHPTASGRVFITECLMLT